MKSFITAVVVLSAFLLKPAFADPTMQIKLSGNTKDMYLCTETTKCVNIAAGVKGYPFAMQQGDMRSIVLVDRVTRRMYPQTMPNSCKINVDSKLKKATVLGSIGKPVNDNITINNLRCTTS